MNNETNDESKKDIDFYNKKSSTGPSDLSAVSIV
jgi:hypothetical protein